MKRLLAKSIYTLSIVTASLAFNSSYATDAAPKFDCTLTDQMSANNEPGGAKSTFSKTTAAIYLVCNSDDVKKGQTIKSVWIAADTHNVAPTNYKIDEKSIQVPGDLASDQTYTTNFSLSKPTNNWPLGSYHVDIYVDNQMVKSVNFSVQ